jgi:hypothetical protein
MISRRIDGFGLENIQKKVLKAVRLMVFAADKPVDAVCCEKKTLYHE